MSDLLDLETQNERLKEWSAKITLLKTKADKAGTEAKIADI